MLTLQLNDDRELGLVEHALPPVASGDRLVHTLACGICQTDCKMLRTGHRDLVLPRTLGHEVVARDPETGRLYAVWPGRACGACRFCRAGRENLCTAMRILGFHEDGGLATALIAPAASLLPLPEGLEPLLGTLAEPLACGLNCLDRLAAAGFGPEPDPQLFVFGAGPVGLLTAFAARRRGYQPCLVEPHELRRDAVASLTATLGLELVAAPPRARAIPAAVTATSALEAFGATLRAVGTGGGVAFFSGLPGGNTVAAVILNAVHYRELSLVGAYGCTRAQLKAALELLGGEPALSSIISETIAWPADPAAAAELIAAVTETTERMRRREVLRVVVRFPETV